MTRHLYIHAPLCLSICTFCDFKRELLCENDSGKVIAYLIASLQKFKAQQFETIYIGGGTPNAFSVAELKQLLGAVKGLLEPGGEFSIECNPDLVNEQQALVLRDNGVNRISLGVQSTNNKILKILNRTHTIQDCQNVIKLLQKVGFNNISLDFMYALPLMKIDDIKSAVNFVKANQVQHCSFYGLDLKPGAILTKQKFKINEEDEADQLEVAIQELDRIGFERYEVSNWALSKQFQSRHNLAYWLSKDWAAVGYGAHGFENKVAYEYCGSLNNVQKQSYELSLEEYYQQVLLMGMRLVSGINITLEPYKSAFEFYKDKLRFYDLKDNMLKSKNINLLNQSFIDII